MATEAANDPAEAFGQTDGFVDLELADDGAYLCQLHGLSGLGGVHKAEEDGSLSLVQEVGDGLPALDTRGLVVF